MITQRALTVYTYFSIFYCVHLRHSSPFENRAFWRIPVRLISLSRFVHTYKGNTCRSGDDMINKVDHSPNDTAINIAMITSTFPKRERGLALGLNAVMVALGVSAGPTIGGVITQYLTWRWIFYVNIPLGIVVLLAAFYFYREERPQRGQHGRFDTVGGELLATGFAAFTLGLSFGQEWGWLSLGTLGTLCIGVVAL